MQDYFSGLLYFQSVTYLLLKREINLQLKNFQREIVLFCLKSKGAKQNVTDHFTIKQVSISFATFCSSFRVHALACFRQRSAAEIQTKVWTLNEAKYLITYAHLLIC